MALTLPQFIAIQLYSQSDKGNACCKDDGSVGLEERSVFSTRVKIEAERSTISDSYIHLRFVYSNKFWQKSGDSSFIVAQSNQPDEDTTRPSCTLFEAVKVSDDVFYLKHVQSGGRLLIDDATLGFYVGANPITSGGYLSFVNCDTLVNFPTFSQVAFKGDNEQYLKAYEADDLPYLQFGSSDPNDGLSGHWVTLKDDGTILVYSKYWEKYWKLYPNWVRAGEDTAAMNDVNILFRPVKIGAGNTVALRSQGNNMFCKRLDADWKTGCLNASDPSITRYSKMQVEELVSGRRIYNVRYRMEDARIFNEVPYVAGATTVTNYGDEESSMSVSIEYQNETSYSFSHSLSLTTGVTTSIEADVLGIVGGSIGVSFDINTALEWGETTTTTSTITATDNVNVPARTTVSVSYVGTRGTCNVPFDYTQEDTSSEDGSPTQIDQIDGIFTGVNCFNFSFNVEKPHPL